MPDRVETFTGVMVGKARTFASEAECRRWHRDVENAIRLLQDEDYIVCDWRGRALARRNVYDA